MIYFCRITLAFFLVIINSQFNSSYAADNACAGNLVWLDSNADGIKNSDEKGMAGINIRLENTYGLVIDRQNLFNGYYSLCASRSGDYRIIVEIPGGYSVSPRHQGTSVYHDSDADYTGSIDVSLVAGKNIGKFDIGLVPDSSVNSSGNSSDYLSSLNAHAQIAPSINVNTGGNSEFLFGLWVEHRHRNDGVFGNFSAAQLSSTTSTILDILNDAEHSNTRLFLQLGSAAEWGWDFSTQSSTFTLQKWKRSIDRFAHNTQIRNAIQNAINNGIIRAVYLIDEPHHKRWSPYGNSNNYITNAHIDEMARHIKHYWSNAKTIVRASPRVLASYGRGRHNWKHLDESFLMINYRKWANYGDRTIESFMEREIAEANLQNINLVGSVQMLIGAPTSNSTWWPNTGINAPQPVGKLRVSPLELRAYVNAFLQPRNTTGQIDADGDTPFSAIMIFRWDRNNETDWDNIHYYKLIHELAGMIQSIR